MAPTLRSLLKTEHFINDALDMVLRLIENYDEQKTLLEGWKAHVCALYTEFKSIRLQTEVLMDQEEPETENYEKNLRKTRIDFETKYLKTYSLIVTKLEKLKKQRKLSLILCSLNLTQPLT